MEDLNETKIIYHIDEEETPYLVKVPVPPDRVTLGDFKNVLNRPSYKFFFKSMDDVFGVVKVRVEWTSFCAVASTECSSNMKRRYLLRDIVCMFYLSSFY
jgi:hypothetical protein